MSLLWDDMLHKLFSKKINLAHVAKPAASLCTSLLALSHKYQEHPFLIDGGDWFPALTEGNTITRGRGAARLVEIQS